MTTPTPLELLVTREDSAWRLIGAPAGTRALGGAGVVVEAPRLNITHPAAPDAQIYRHGWTSWSPTAWWRLDRDPWRVWGNPERTATAEDAATDTAERHRSYLLGAIAVPRAVGEEPLYLLVGALDGASGRIDLLPGRIEARPLDSEDPAPGRWWIGLGPEHEVFASWTRALEGSLSEAGRLLPRREEPGPVWSSWYSWFEEVSASAIDAEIGPAQRSGYAVLQIDDGWERGIGDWEANDDFPEGMGAIAERIRAAGMTPGLWIAPFIASAQSRIALDHPEYFVSDEAGAPAIAGYNWGAPYYALDCTRPEALDWVRETVSRIVSWGYGYLKLDFLNAAAIPGSRHRRLGREEAYRTGLHALRESAPECYIMASGAVIAPSIGIVDGMRVGPDTAPYWDNTERKKDPSGPGVRNALRNSLARFWLSSLTDIDPDVAICRTHGSLLSEEACQITRDIALATGVVGCSDPDAWLTDPERERVAELCASARRGARVERLSRYRFSIDSRLVDFEPWISPSVRMSDRILAK